MWTWVKGDTVPNSPGNYGTQGISDPQNTPPAISFVGRWIDLQGNFWMFGGWSGPLYNDLWKFDPVSENWTWVKGPGVVNDPGYFGTQGIPSPLNNPPCMNAPMTWTDNSGNLWLYGGFGECGGPFDNELAALWKYEIASNEWTWINGQQQCHISPSFGSLNTPDPSNTPGSRYWATSTWVQQDTLFLFGGRNGNQPYKFYSDIWKYDLSTNEWTWIKGPNVENQSSIYGTMGVPDSLNNPSARGCVSSWTSLNGDFWMWGGDNALPSDIWKYDHLTHDWTWVSGIINIIDTGNYEGECSQDTLQRPAQRIENSAIWRNKNDLVFTFGASFGIFCRNDLWVYCSSVNRWVLLKGNNLLDQPGHYGIQGIADIANIPSSRGESASWIDSTGRLWLWGGIQSNGWKNDLWRFVVDYNCFENVCDIHELSFFVTDSRLCEKFCTNFFDQSINNPTAWQWQFPGGDPSSSTDQNPTNICYDSPGTYDVTLITTNANGSDTLTLPNYITVYPTPPFPTITQVGYTLTSSPSNFYQWQLNSIDISGATNQSYTVMQTGLYTVMVSDSNGCVNSANQYVLIDGIVQLSNENISIYPNPSSGSFMVEWLNGPDLIGMVGEVSIDVVNTLGQKVFSSKESRSIGTAADFSKGVHTDKKEIDLGDVARGIYFMEIKTENESVRKKILIAD